jgi:3-oxoacyl-[acyl-carrier protein] reductase
VRGWLPHTVTMFSLQGKSVVVTGGSKGIGRGIALVFAAAGANVAIAARSAADVDAAVAEADAAGPGKVIGVIADVSQRDSCVAMAAAAVSAFGGIDVLCANAGIFPDSKLMDMTEDEIDRIFATNVKGTMLSVKACVPALERSGHGRVIVTSSITGPFTGFPGWSHYGATKAAQLGFIRTACIELAKRTITINAVLPGNVVSEGLDELGEDYRRQMESSIPLGRLGDVSEIGATALFLATDEAGYITGQTIVVDGGQTVPESLMALQAV